MLPEATEVCSRAAAGDACGTLRGAGGPRVVLFMWVSAVKKRAVWSVLGTGALNSHSAQQDLKIPAEFSWHLLFEKKHNDLKTTDHFLL